LVAFLDSDDYWLPGKVTAAVKSFQDQPDTGLTYSDYYEVDSADDRCLGIRSPHDNPSLEQMLHRLECVGALSSVTVRRAVFEQVGGFDERLHWGEDIDIYLRLRQICLFHRIPGPLTVYRKRTQIEDSVRAYPRQTHATLEQVMREHFGREANWLIKQMRDQRAAGLLSLALTQLKNREWRKTFGSFGELATNRPMYAPRVALNRLRNRRRG
jgi:GT2 family glycosyltransferase